MSTKEALIGYEDSFNYHLTLDCPEKKLAAEAASKAPSNKDQFLPYVRAAVAYWRVVEARAIEADFAAAAFKATEQRLLYEQTFRDLSGRDYYTDQDAITEAEIDAIPLPPPTPTKPERTEADTSRGTYLLSGSERERQGETIWNSNRWLWSTQFVRCPWLRKHEYGPRHYAALEEAGRLREQLGTCEVSTPTGSYATLNSGADAIKEAMRRAGAFEAAETESYGEYATRAENNVVNAVVHAMEYEDPDDSFVWRRDGFHGHNPRVNYDFTKRFATVANSALTELQRQYYAARRRVVTAKKEDQAEAESYPADDGPRYLVVVKNQHNANYKEDPECFGGDRWITVAPPTES